jgi:hypothetical protein
VPLIATVIYQEKPNETATGAYVHAIRGGEWGNIALNQMIDGESQSFAGAIPTAHRLLFFITGGRSSVINCEPGYITPFKRGGKDYEITTGRPNHETTISCRPHIRRG